MDLPIYKYKQQIIERVCGPKSRVTFIQGETGSGKTTQVPQYLWQHHKDIKGGVIGVTQPRRVAAMNLAQRVAHEMGTALGDKVGYRVRFEQ
jgi:HrpA-like RNA helicase